MQPSDSLPQLSSNPILHLLQQDSFFPARGEPPRPYLSYLVFSPSFLISPWSRGCCSTPHKAAGPEASGLVLFLEGGRSIQHISLQEEREKRDGVRSWLPNLPITMSGEKGSCLQVTGGYQRVNISIEYKITLYTILNL